MTWGTGDIISVVLEGGRLPIMAVTSSEVVQSAGNPHKV